MEQTVLAVAEGRVSNVSNAAAELGRRGGSRTSPAKAAASRMNGARGGRPVRTHIVGDVEVHADAVLIGYTAGGRVALTARTASAARWLKRHGFVYAGWELTDPPEGWNGRCWA